ncbi:hypothetical protein [Mesobacillus subterraneus]|uniref:Asp23/Gls24 family envelope stress response protein n=1 Tax=Mesobacillus subterraneus TaxID=285983 RepID=A0A3R9KX86_9BACI|nr:hypothetical protein [Mesobacillus subterraneus]RSD28144.1 hypothetical protein EJA10_06720 [Mesobacillus subterraneus]
MKNSRKIMPPHYREVCRAVCAIVHANLDEDRFFQPSRAWKRSSFFSARGFSFSDHGVIVGIEQDLLNVKIYATALTGDFPLYQTAFLLQERIAEEIRLLTSIFPNKIDIVITSVRTMQKKTQ